jgi:NADH-quinone oxidoreductase subunit E
LARWPSVQVCGTPPCALCGSGELMELLEKEIGPKEHIAAPTASSPGKRSSAWAPASNAPMAAINDDYYEDLTPASLKALLDEFRAGRTPPPGSAIGRQATRSRRRPADLDRSLPSTTARAPSRSSSPTPGAGLTSRPAMDLALQRRRLFITLAITAGR